MVLLKVPVSPRWWPVAMPEALAIVKVGNSECGFLKLTPLSRSAAIAGAVSGVTFSARNPSGMNRIRLCGAAFWAKAAAADNSVRPADSHMVERRMYISLEKRVFRPIDRRSCLVLLCDGNVTCAPSAGKRHLHDSPGLWDWYVSACRPRPLARPFV